jgi:transcriptional/translational regulatory protein YebC/TACO1
LARAKLFGRISSKIINAVRLGGSNTDPKANLYLNAALEEARKAQMPKFNVEAALAKGAGISASGLVFEWVMYEGRSREGISIVIVAL